MRFKYPIEDGKPIPEPRRSMGAPRSTQTEWTRTLDQLRPGQSTISDDWRDFKSASSFAQRRPERKFRIRKIPGEGWRVWRVE